MKKAPKTEDQEHIDAARRDWLQHPYTRLQAGHRERNVEKLFPELLSVAMNSTDPKVVAAASRYVHEKKLALWLKEASDE